MARTAQWTGSTVDADEVARFGGSWRFIISFGLVLVAYTATNVWLGRQAWDPYPFILLNLFLSMLASVQAPVIMMSQNRQDTKDRVRADLDYQVNLKAELDLMGLHDKLDDLRDQRLAKLMVQQEEQLEILKRMVAGAAHRA